MDDAIISRIVRQALEVRMHERSEYDDLSLHDELLITWLYFETHKIPRIAWTFSVTALEDYGDTWYVEYDPRDASMFWAKMDYLREKRGSWFINDGYINFL